MKLADVKSAFQRAGDVEAIAPRKSVKLEVADFSDTWSKKPRSAVVVGLRLLSGSDENVARETAARAALEVSDREMQVERFNDALRSMAVALAICDPNDIEKSHPLFPMAEDSVPEALTSRATARLFEELERLHLESSPIFPEADDEEIHQLAVLLSADEPLAGLSASAAARLRKYLWFALSELIDSGHSPADLRLALSESGAEFDG